MDKNNYNNAFPTTPESFKNKVRTTLSSLPDEEENGCMEKKLINKKGLFKNKVAAILVATMALGTTAFAAGKVFSIVGHSSNIPVYRELPTEDKIQNDFGFTPKLVSKFNNGYEFKNGYSSVNEGFDEAGNSLVENESVSFSYSKGSDKFEVMLNMENVLIGEKSENEVVVDTYKDIDLSYIEYANKFVPGDYELTEQDKLDEQSGKYVFSYGSNEIEISTMQYLSWEQDGIYYSFNLIDSDISKDELVEMAHEVIDAK